jgi:hypothetical protein
VCAEHPDTGAGCAAQRVARRAERSAGSNIGTLPSTSLINL